MSVCYIFAERNMHFAVSNSELLVSATEKQKRKNINYYNHHHHPSSCVKFTYFHCFGLDASKEN